MRDYITETARELPVKYQPDVLVAGGGIAGIAAALAAARNGADVLLIEKQCMVGGLATSGLIAGYLPLCDGNGVQVSFGIAEELLRLSIRLGAQSELPEHWLEKGPAEERKKKRYEVQFNPQYLALLAERQLTEENIHILYDTRICVVKYRENRIEGIMAENESGRFAITAKSYVDATGTALLYELAGLPTRMFARGNILAGWYYYSDGGSLRLRPLGYAEVFDEEKKDTVKPLINRRFYGIDGQEITDFLILSHRETLKDLQKLKETAEGIEPAAIAGMPQLRMIRCMQGEYCLKESENDVSFSDSIGMIADWRKRGMVYEIPYRTLYSGQLRNVISAGRCISVDDGMWDISRVIPPCAVTGEAAGTAAALTTDFTELSYGRLAEKLKKQGQKLKLSEIYEDKKENGEKK